jgi:tetratricopeptide (TPR) repeat protein
VRRVVLALALALVACDGARRVSTPPHEQPAESSSEALLLALSEARSHHAQADLYLADGDVDAATRSLARVLEVRFPAGASEAEDTRLDARARLARLYLRAGRLDDADRVIDAGLTGAARRSFFLANLYAVSGERWEARARALAGDAEGARRARRAALAAYDQSLSINAELQARLHGTKESP